MTIRRTIAIAVAAALTAICATPNFASAQVIGAGPNSGGGGHAHGGGSLIGLGIGIAAEIIAHQSAQSTPQGPGRKPPGRQSNQTSPSQPNGIPPANERRYVPDEVLVEVPNTTPAATIDAVERLHRLTRLETQQSALLGSTILRFRIPDRSTVPAILRALRGDRRVAFSWPNYLHTLQQQTNDNSATAAAAKPKSYGDPAQYSVAKMRLAEAHAIAKGGEIRIAVIDSGIDPDQPELSGAIVEKFDALKSPFAPHSHGTAIAALIAGHNRLMGSAPEARILAVRAFDPAGNAAEATTFNIIRALDWAVVQRARIINMSFAGPADPGINRALDVAFKKNIVLIAAAGNAGAKSPPLYPAANPNVIAVAASDSSDQLFPGSNRGRHIAVAAPGVDILVAVPFGGYEVSSGTSYSAASVSGIVALMLQRKPDLTPAAVRDILLATAKDVGKKGRDDEFGAGIADAYRAVSEVPGGKVSDALPPK
jgi:hypothetical protein